MEAQVPRECQEFQPNWKNDTWGNRGKPLDMIRII